MLLNIYEFCVKRCMEGRAFRRGALAVTRAPVLDVRPLWRRLCAASRSTAFAVCYFNVCKLLFLSFRLMNFCFLIVCLQLYMDERTDK
jgi:hypothetical protein